MSSESPGEISLKYENVFTFAMAQKKVNGPKKTKFRFAQIFLYQKNRRLELIPMNLFSASKVVDFGRKTAQKGRKMTPFLQILGSGLNGQDEIYFNFLLHNSIGHIVNLRGNCLRWSKISHLTLVFDIFNFSTHVVRVVQ